VQHDHALGPEAHRVEELRLRLELGGREGADPLVRRVQHRVLAGVRGQADAELERAGADALELRGALGDLPMELRQVGVRGVGRQRGRHPVHAQVVAVEVLEDRREPLERDTQVRPGLPAARVVGGKAALAEDLHREAEAVHLWGRVLPR
jgi:hypothetical protein